MTRQEMAAVMLSEGPWEYRRRSIGDAWNTARTPTWDWDNFEFRVKPQPKVLWVNEYGESGDSVSAYRSKGEAQRSFILNSTARCAVRYVESPES